MTNIICVKDLKKYFGKLHAIDGISFNVKQGEIFGFLGPNGAGKTTAIRCIMGFNRPTSGSISVFGCDMTTNPVAAKWRIGYLPGNVKLYDNWTGWEHIHFFERVRGKSNNINDLIKRLDFDPTAKFRHLSSGNKQKLGLILALMHDPKLLIMDEPTVGLDPLLQYEIHKVLMEARDRGMTILISSHNMPEVELLCDRVALIRDGKLIVVENIKAIGDKKLHKIEVRFGDKFNVSEFNIDGVDRVEEIADGVLITVGGDLNPVLRALVKHNIVDFEITHASLEAVFMKFYEKGDK